MDSGAQSFSVSVIIPVYNAEKTLERAVRSALAQPEAGLVILIDDSSSDRSQDIARKLAGEDSRILYHRFQVNRGPAAARNKGIELSQGTWVALLDADDYWQDGRLEKLLPYADGYDVLADDLLLEGDAGSLFHVEQGQIQPVNLETYLLSNLPQKGKTRTELSFIKPLFRRDFLDKNGIRYDEEMRLGEDYDFYARLLIAGAQMALVPAQGYVYTISPNSLSACHSAEDLKALRVCNQRLEEQPDLSRSEKKIIKKIGRFADCRYQWQRLIDAVKEKNVVKAFACFLRPWPVPLYLTSQLFCEFKRRVLRLP